MSDERPLNPLAAMTLVLVFPRKTFERLTERPHWALPVLFVVGASMMSALFAVRAGFMDEFLADAAATAGRTETEVRGAFLAAGVVMAVVVVPLVMLVEALLYRLAGSVAGGRTTFRVAFAAVAHASIPVGIGSLVLACLMPFTRSARAGANLAFLFDPGRHEVLWSVARQIDLFSIWFFVLLGIAAEPIFGLPRRRARLAALGFALAYVLIMSWSGKGAFGPGV